MAVEVAKAAWEQTTAAGGGSTYKRPGKKRGFRKAQDFPWGGNKARSACV